MNRLRNKDLTTLIKAIEVLNADVDMRTLPERALASVASVVDADSVAFTGFRYGGELSGLVWDGSDAISPEEMEIFAAHVHEQPLFSAFLIERRSETLKITDIVPRAKFERTGLYNEFYRRVGVKNQLVSPLKVAKDLLVTCSINTARPDFSQRDETVMNLIAPHLNAAIRNAFTYDRLSAALETSECGVIAMDSDGRIAFVSEFARQLLNAYFPAERGLADSLPEPLSSWLRQGRNDSRNGEFQMPLTPLKIVNQIGELTVRQTYNHQTRESTLLLEARSHPSPEKFEILGLTKRESEILFLIAQGKADGDIAQLCGISSRTVHKHVANIYTKLGVETRTAAMLRALEAM